jgi:ferrochelatase
MRYGSISIYKGLKELNDKGVSEFIILPLYPHYAMSSYETVVEKVKEEVKINFPENNIKVIKPFYDNPKYIELLSQKINDTIKDKEYDHILFSYHGIPVSHLKISDPTNSHCYKINNCCSVSSEAHKTCYKHQVTITTELVAKYLGLDKEKYSISFQSRLANEPWLKPYTDSELERLAKEGKKNMVVVTPAFVTDCLETLEEIVMEAKEEFLEAGGENYYYVPCLNDDDNWAKLISKWAKIELST